MSTMAIDRDGNCTYITLEACERVYTPQGVEQVIDVTGLPGVIMCKALWASFGKEKALYKICILLFTGIIIKIKKIFWNHEQPSSGE